MVTTFEIAPAAALAPLCIVMCTVSSIPMGWCF